MSEFQVGDRVEYIHGGHEGVVVAAGGDEFLDAYLIKRDSDGFEWFGTGKTMKTTDAQVW